MKLLTCAILLAAAACGGEKSPVAPSTSPLSVESAPGEASCTAYSLARAGGAVELPDDVKAAFECPMIAPVITADGSAVVYAGGSDALELRYWSPGASPRVLATFDAGADGMSEPSWSPSGTKLAIVVKASSYPEGTRLFAFTVSPTGEVSGASEHDVAVFSPCGSVCTPFTPNWKDEATLDVVTPGDAEPGPTATITLK